MTKAKKKPIPTTTPYPTPTGRGVVDGILLDYFPVWNELEHNREVNEVILSDHDNGYLPYIIVY